jgi:hypothetical protein
MKASKGREGPERANDMMTKAPKEITVCNLEVIVMPNGEILCLGQTIGWITTFGKALTEKSWVPK